MSSPPDFPAAHSMDTTWFAVDRDGHVAIFSSGEAGAVPKDAWIGEEGLGMLDVPDGALPDSEAVYVRESRVRPGAPHLVVIPRATTIGGALAFVDDPAVVAREVGLGVAREVRATAGYGLLYRDMSPADHERLHASNECGGCGYEFNERPPAASGFFQYEHGTDNQVAGPYDLDAKPTVPLREEDLPPALRGHVVRFEGCFEETTALQPVERWACEAWGAAYLTGDGREVKPIPGKEKEYAAEAATLADMPGVTVQPPDPALTGKPGRPWWRLW